MMICYYCYWGWPKRVAEVYKEALEKLQGDETPLLFGPAHIVWEDENFGHAEECLKDFDGSGYDLPEEQLKVVRESLIKLTEIPLNERCIVPDEYDGKFPENYPPKVMTVFV